MFYGLYNIPKYTIRIIQKHEEGEQIRKHHKRRINKKWLKKYGTYGRQKIDKGQVLLIGDVLYMSRPQFRKLKQGLNWKIKNEQTND